MLLLSLTEHAIQLIEYIRNRKIHLRRRQKSTFVNSDPWQAWFRNAGDVKSSSTTKWHGSKTAFIAAKFLDSSITVQLVKLSLEVQINKGWEIQECEKCLSTGTEGKMLIACLKPTKSLMWCTNSSHVNTSQNCLFFLTWNQFSLPFTNYSKSIFRVSH